MRVQLIVKRDSRMTGLRRYGDALWGHLANEGLDVELLSPSPRIPGVAMKLGRWIGWDLAAFSQSYPLWSRLGQADIYHLTSESLATLLLLSKKRPSIVTVHALFTYLLRGDPKLSTYNHVVDRWFDALAVRGLRRARAIITVSNYLRDVLIDQVGIPAGRIHVVPEAVDHTAFRPIRALDALRDKYGLGADARYVLYVGSEQPRKNFLTLVRAFARLQKRLENVRLLKIGQPEVRREREKARTLIRELGIERSVTFLGHVGEELPLFYNLSDLFVFPSLYEGFGFPPLESMACGTPVICSNTTSLPEVVGDAAVLVDPSDESALVEHMERLLVDRKMHEDYRLRGLERARRFHWDRAARQTVDVYRQVMADGYSN